jgi:glutamine phosphoribosylpyrophosphate amidotransferase
MCGIWGYECKGGKPKSRIVESIICGADDRGGHGYGYFGIDKEYNQVQHKSTHKQDIFKTLNDVRGMLVVIGHSRLATSSEQSILNTQPIVVKDAAIVHNGNVGISETVYNTHRYLPTTNNDSEALIPMIKQGTPVTFKHAYIHLKLDYHNYELTYSNKDIPLFQEEIEGVHYFCSKEWRY